MLNDHIRYIDGQLCCGSVPLADVAEAVGTPVYVYSLGRALANVRRIREAFADLKPHLHYSVKANGNLALLRALVKAGVGVDAVSGGEIHRALLAGADPAHIVFAGVGKTTAELRYAVEVDVGWFNVENEFELDLLQELAATAGRSVRVALRLNPDVTAATHRHIATGHGSAKFGLGIGTVKTLLAEQSRYPMVRIEGIHVHIGSQLHSTQATRIAVESALDCIAPYPEIRTVNLGGGLAVPYVFEETVPDWRSFAVAVAPLLQGYHVLLEPGRSVIADAGVLVTTVLYEKTQAEQRLTIVDASMAELLRPALYDAHHEIMPLTQQAVRGVPRTNVVGPVCESTDVLGQNCLLPVLRPGDLLAILTAGAYGMVMASNYNQRPRPPEVVVDESGERWQVARRRETWDDLTALEMP